MSVRVLLAGGGTAGHVNPLLVVAKELQKRDPQAVIRILGPSAGLEATLVPQAGFEIDTIEKTAIPRRPSLEFFRLPKKLWNTVRQIQNLIKKHDIGVVIGFGGYVSAPAYLAARRSGIPIIIHEQNSKAGLANKLGARWAKYVGCAFQETQLAKANFIGMPLREQIMELVALDAPQVAVRKANLAQKYGLDPNHATVLITGGSLGAQRLNDALSASLPQVTSRKLNILHLTGKGKLNAELQGFVTREANSEIKYRAFEYSNAMHELYLLADIVICRSGAGTVCELMALKKPALFVPLPIGNGEQARNASQMVSLGAAEVIADDDFSSKFLTQFLKDISETSSTRLRCLSEKAGTLTGLNAAEILVSQAINIQGS